jgi:hypothetical protein
VVTEAVWVGVTHVQAADTRLVGQAVRVQATVLRCVVVRVDSGGGLRWLEPMVEMVCMHVWAPCQSLVRAVVVRRQTR